MATEQSKDARFAALELWVNSNREKLGAQHPIFLESASDDASFRRYFRTRGHSESYIAVDAPPAKENNRSFVEIQQKLDQAGLRVPMLIAVDLENGFLLLSDLGDDLLLPKLQAASLPEQESWYRRGLSEVASLSQVDTSSLPQYDRAKLMEEMELFPQWFLDKHLSIDLTPYLRGLLLKTAELMVESALEQPALFVHRDFHARNLMIQSDQQLALIDFQDAVCGPMTYDVVSLLKDCYWQLPRASVVNLVEEFRQSQSPDVGAEVFLRWFDFMGFQRHLKCAGIFCRLYHRDGKSGYLNDIPLVLQYMVEVASIYPELSELGRWLEDEITPRLHLKT